MLGTPLQPAMHALEFVLFYILKKYPNEPKVQASLPSAANSDMGIATQDLTHLFLYEPQIPLIFLSY